MSNKQENMNGAYAAWMGRPVRLKIRAEQMTTSLLCTIIGESNATLRIRISGEWDVDIFKEMVVAVDAYPRAGMNSARPDFGEPQQPAQPAYRTASAGVAGRPGGEND
jgi:hypothetical protein